MQILKRNLQNLILMDLKCSNRTKVVLNFFHLKWPPKNYDKNSKYGAPRGVMVNSAWVWGQFLTRLFCLAQYSRFPLFVSFLFFLFMLPISSVLCPTIRTRSWFGPKQCHNDCLSWKWPFKFPLPKTRPFRRSIWLQTWIDKYSPT